MNKFRHSFSNPVWAGLLLALCTFVTIVVISACSSNHAAALPPLGPQEVDFPADADFINVRDYGATGNGTDDDTEAIRSAIQENLNQHKTLFFPSGTYLVSDSLEWKDEEDVFYAFSTFQGEGTARTIIQLQDRAAGFADPENPKPITRPGSIESREDGSGNRAHSNYIFDMTFDTGKGNSGAIGVDFTANNTGAMENVLIRSGDGQGTVGLNLTRDVGPCLIKNVTVQGFDIGILSTSALHGITLEDIQLENQNIVGLKNLDNVLAIRKLTSINTVPAIINGGEQRWRGPIVVVDSELLGGSTRTAAIRNTSEIFVRNVRVDGYSAAIQNGEAQIASPIVEEFTSSSPISLFEASSRKSLNLTVEETPVFVDNDLSHWANVEAYGATRNDDVDDSQAIQEAIDAGKSTVYFPQGTYKIGTPVVVRGEVKRIIGFHSRFSPTDILFQFQNENHPVILERFNFFNEGSLERQTSQPIVVRHAIKPALKGSAPGSWFIENAVAQPIVLTEGQNLYAHQLNCELPPPEPMVSNEGGVFWVLGYKTEFGNTVAATSNDGKTEILGGLFYPSQGVKDPTIPLLINQNSSVSATYREIAFGPTYTVHIEETQQGETKILTRESMGTGEMIPVTLYAGRL
ncbi:MAG: glycosyl hydrolase family 28-related protein [Cyanobacteria bacterium P01_D01_bin.56]